MRGERGQALVEVAWLVPLMAALIGAVVAAGVWLAARSAADSAAHSAAVALIEQRDPVAAARTAVPGWAARGVVVRATGRTVRVTVSADRVPAPLRAMLAAESILRVGGAGR